MPGLGSSGGGGKCNYYNRTGNTTDPFSIRANYGGIPEALVLNLLGWLALLVLFLVIRKNVFNVLSRGLQRNLGRITEVLFSPDLSRESLSDSESSESAGRPVDPETGEDVQDLESPGARQSELARRTSQEAGGFLSWLSNTLKCLLYSEQTMLQLAGPDAVQYLRQRLDHSRKLEMLLIMGAHAMKESIIGRPYAIKNQRKARNTPSRGLLVP